MAFINKQDTNGTKGTLLKGELGYDDYTAGGDTGRVYVGNGSTNIALAKKTEVDEKQVTLVSGTNIKTINSTSLLGSGDISITETTWVANDSRAKTALNSSGSAPIYACRAWVNFNGTGTVAIKASGNISSITDNGAGYYTVKFTTALPDANYSVVCGAAGSNTQPLALGPSNKTTSSCDVRCLNMNDAIVDPTFTDVAIFR